MQNSAIKKKLDKAIQQARTGKICLVCGNPAIVRHHFIQKKQSEYLRYNEKNLIDLCGSCHLGIHSRGDPAITDTIIRKKGRAWFNWIEKSRRIFVKQDKNYFEKLKKLYEEYERKNINN